MHGVSHRPAIVVNSSSVGHPPLQFLRDGHADARRSRLVSGNGDGCFRRRPPGGSVRLASRDEFWLLPGSHVAPSLVARHQSHRLLSHLGRVGCRVGDAVPRTGLCGHGNLVYYFASPCPDHRDRGRSASQCGLCAGRDLAGTSARMAWSCLRLGPDLRYSDDSFARWRAPATIPPPQSPRRSTRPICTSRATACCRSCRRCARA